MIRGAIFDFDGTLYDSMHVWDHVGTDYLTSMNRVAKPDFRQSIAALSLYQAACFCREEYALDATVEEVMQGFNKTVEKYYFNEVLPKAGMVSLLEKLKAQGVKMCVATATDRHLIEAALKRCALDTYFETILTCSPVGHGKDEPIIYRKAMEALGTDRMNTLVFEDALHALTTAKRDGFLTVAVVDSYEKRQDQMRALADFYFPDYTRDEDFWKFAAAL